jgi:hypothetical protein
MANTSQVNSNNIQTIIESKISLLSSIVAMLQTVVSTYQPSYDIDGQSVDKNTYMKYLTDMQMMETKAIKELIELQNIIMPYQFQSQSNGSYGSFGGWY